MSFSSLPTDIVDHIFSYTGVLKPRNGKYMGQISPTDERYELLRKIPRKFSNEKSRYGDYCYDLRINKFLTIHVYLYFYTLPPEYVYDFRMRSRKYTYTPK